MLGESESMATKEKEEVETEREGTTDGPLLDLSDDAVKKMIKAAKKRGYVTLSELNAVLPSEETDPDRIEDINAMLSDMGINVVEDDEANEDGEQDNAADAEDDANELAEQTGTAVAATPAKKEPTDRTDDPVRMYLREMGSVELLSREGEIAIAKRIEAGRETMIAGLCESPLTFQAIIIWRDELNEGKILLRDIIDLEATYAGPEAKQAPVVVPRPDEEGTKPAATEDRFRSRWQPPARTKTSPMIGADMRGIEGRRRGRRRGENHVARRHGSGTEVRRSWRPSTSSPTPTRSCASCRTSRSRPGSRPTSALSSSQDRRLQEAEGRAHQGGQVAVAQCQNRIEALVEQLYDINKRLGFRTRASCCAWPRAMACVATSS
jgi:RNA polymerase primary sigma factor